MKKANRIILATKCSIIRDAQIAEKNEIAREFHNENLRLEKIMLEERDKALAEEELKREQERKNLLKYSKEIRKQLEERELIRAKEVERIEEEAVAMKKALDVIEKVRESAKGRGEARSEKFFSFKFTASPLPTIGTRIPFSKIITLKETFSYHRKRRRKRKFETQKLKRFARACRSRANGVNISKTWSLKKVREIEFISSTDIASSYFLLLVERIAELKVQEYMRQKLEREKRLALERRMAKEEKEKEYDRILQRQQKLMESKTERNELEYRRQREDVERVFRRREKEAAIKKREMAEDIAKARNVQLEEVVSGFDAMIIIFFPRD